MIINHFKLKFYAFLEFFLGPNPNFFGVLYSQIEVIFFNDKYKQVHQDALRYIKLQSKLRCTQVHQAASRDILSIQLH